MERLWQCKNKWNQYFILVWLFVFVNKNIFAQASQAFQLCTSIGSHRTELGFSVGNYAIAGDVQVNTCGKFVYCFRNIGKRKNFWQATLQGGLLVGFGNDWQSIINKQFLSVEKSMLPKKNSIGYVYSYYADSKGTSQATATICLQHQHWQLFSENDGFAFLPFDRYRTGSFVVCYTDSLIGAAAQVLLWTGATQKGTRVHTSVVKNKYGLLDISKNKYGKTSAGLLFGSFGYALPMGQNIYCQTGIDAEKIRQFFQNKLIHDNAIVHALHASNQNAQISMLDTAGNAYLQKTQVVKKQKFYWQLGTGNFISY
jgi:hypothetical protein